MVVKVVLREVLSLHVAADIPPGKVCNVLLGYGLVEVAKETITLLEGVQIEVASNPAYASS